MKCPTCAISMEKALVSGVDVDYCPRCYGLWFDQGELQEAKDKKDRDLRWLDVDLWRDPGEFRVSKGLKLCPTDRMPLYEVRYGDSQVKVDVCGLCYGVWLDRGEFKDIISYVREKADEEVLNHYLKNLVQEGWEIFSGPELLKEELLDFLTILKILGYKLSAQHPKITELISVLPK